MKLTRKDVQTITIGRKLFFSFGAAVAITLLITFVGFTNNEILSGTIDRVVASTSIRQALANDISLRLAQLLSLERGMNLRALVKDAATVDAYNREYLVDSDRLVALDKQLAPLLTSETDRQLCSQLVSLTSDLRQLHERIYADIAGGEQHSAAAAPYLIYRDRFLPQANAAEFQAAHLLENQLALIQQESVRAHRIEERSRYLTSSMLVLFFIFGGVLTSIVAGSARSLREITVSLGAGATQIAAAAFNVSSSSESVARGASEQAAFIEQTAASVEEIAAMARRNTSDAQSTAGVVAESQRQILEGNRALDEMVSAMDGIALSSTEILRIVKVIDQIAFQTNILALNAAVEAARAGDAGLSFAVVANEVRDLSQRSAQAAKDTAQLIDGCIAKSQIGKLKLSEVAAAIYSITTQSAKVKLLIDEISVGSREQSRGIDQVNQAILQMGQVVRGTAAGAEQSATASGHLHTEFQTLKSITDELANMLGTKVRLRLPLA